MAQFYRTGQIAGDAFRLQIAAMMSANIVDVETGEISNVLLESPNADQTNSLRLTRSLGNVLNAAVRSSTALKFFLGTALDESGRQAYDTSEAFANLARDPAQNVDDIYAISKFSRKFRPDLTDLVGVPNATAKPDQWSITVKVHDTGDEDIAFGGVANVDWDADGYAWVANNVYQGTPNSSPYNVVLKPDGSPSDGTNGKPVSPINDGGLLGVGWGVSVDSKNQIWFGNFGWGGNPVATPENYPTQLASQGGTGSVSRFQADGTTSAPNGYYGPYRVQAIEPDINDNIWIASLGYAGSANGQAPANPVGSGIWVFKDGDPSDSAFSLSTPDDAPFGIAPVPDGNGAWATYSGGLAGQSPSYVVRYELNSSGGLDQIFKQQTGDTLKTVTVDFSGNAWVASQETDSVFVFSPDNQKIGEFSGGGVFGPWGLAVDGEGNVWVSNFGTIALNSDLSYGRVSKLCGANPAAWPEGLTFGDPISPSTGYTVPSAGDEVLLPKNIPLYGPGAPPSYKPIMRQTSVQIDPAGNLWAINNWKPRFNVDATVNPGGDGIIIFVGLAPPPPSKF